RVPTLTDAERAVGVCRYWDESDRKNKLALLRQLSSEHVAKLLEAPPASVTVSAEHQNTISQMGLLLAKGRGLIDWREEHGSREIEAVQIEEPFRAIQQLRNLAVALACVHGRTEVTGHDLELARRVVLSSMPASRADVLGMFVGHADGISVRQCAEDIG